MCLYVQASPSAKKKEGANPKTKEEKTMRERVCGRYKYGRKASDEEREREREMLKDEEKDGEEMRVVKQREDREKATKSRNELADPSAVLLDPNSSLHHSSASRVHSLSDPRLL